MLHDLHHVATGFGTDLVGEGENPAWEARGGLGPIGAYAGAIVLGGATFGLAIAPRRVRRAATTYAGKNLFARRHDYERLLEMHVGELRTLLDLPQAGIAAAPRKMNPRTPRLRGAV